MAENPIQEFCGEFRFLSNFWPCNVTLDGDTYRSVEHAYQAAKSSDTEERTRIRNAPTAGEAKRLGRRLLHMRKDWDKVKISVMQDLLRQKFSADPLRSKLLETGTSLLIEGNSWGDRFWGVCRGSGENHLGKLLMSVREELRLGGPIC